MFEKLFGKASDIVYHIAPYAVERQQFLEHCREQGFAKACLKQVAEILLAAATDLQAHGGLDGDGLASKPQRPESKGSALRQASAAPLATTAECFFASLVLRAHRHSVQDARPTLPTGPPRGGRRRRYGASPAKQ